MTEPTGERATEEPSDSSALGIIAQRPGYDQGERAMFEARGPLAEAFARQILETTRPFLPKELTELDVLDVGCGYGHTAIELARRCHCVVGIEPSQPLAEVAHRLGVESSLGNVTFRNEGVDRLHEADAYDLVVLDNVFEHLPNQPEAIEKIATALKPGGVLFLLVPNKLWPIEVHYGLPFLGYLPLSLANRYLRITGKGTDYTDASYAPTYFRLNRILRRQGNLEFHYVLPADLSLTMDGGSLFYRLGTALLRACPWLWVISKALLVVAIKK